MNAAAPRLSIRQLDVHLGARHALRNVTTQISAGEWIAVLGPNGAGKTTFLRAIAGVAAFSGEIRMHQRDWRDFMPRQRSREIAYLEQRGSIAWPLPVREIVALGRPPTAETGRAVHHALEVFGLRDLADRPATELSGGERARTLLARAFASDAPVLLLDEPIGSLDPAWQLATLDQLKAAALAGRTVLAVLHDLSMALRYASRVLLFDAGVLVADATPSGILASGQLDAVFGVRIEALETAGGLVIGASRS